MTRSPLFKTFEIVLEASSKGLKFGFLSLSIGVGTVMIYTLANFNCCTVASNTKPVLHDEKDVLFNDKTSLRSSEGTSRVKSVPF